MRVPVLLLAAVLAALSGCSSGSEEARTTTTTTTTTTRPSTTTTGGGGALEALAELVQAAGTQRCFDDVADDAPSTTGEKTAAAIARDVELLRRLRFDALPRPRYLTSREVDRRVARALDEYPDSEADADGRALVALGALPAGSDLDALLRRSFAGQVAGFYDPKTHELVVQSSQGRELDGVGRVVLAHELDHALVDQAVGLPNDVAAGQPAEGGEDAALAATALVEGDATVLMQAYALAHLSFLDALRSIGPALASERDLEGLPYHLRASMLFPYEEGLRFVCALYERGGWKAVDRAYRQLPASSAEVLFPERFGRGERPVDPPDPRSPGGAWKLVDRQALGAADLLWLFEAPGGDEARALDAARERVGAWAGGELHTWASGERTAVALRLVERPSNHPLCDSIRAWREAAQIEAAVRCSGRHVRVGIARDATTAARLVSS